MCGINGIFSFSEDNIDKLEIKKMNSLLSHRGPDGKGTKMFDKLGLGHTRLSIIDLDVRGSQPMVDFNEEYWIVYNGEIYNYLELRETLNRLGYKFKTKTDTEVILNSYKHWGKKAFSKFNGMFAFCIYNKSEKKLICVRDRFGIKPLYYRPGKEKFIFSSEIKPILSVLDTTPSVNRQTLFNYLHHGRVDYSNLTFFEGIINLTPGHYIEVTSSGYSSEKRWWFFNSSQRKSTVPLLREIFKDSVRLRMRSDVPVGACLSGGIDSTAIVNSALRLTNDNFNTYSAITEDNWKNSENRYITLASQKEKISPKYVKPSGENLIKNLKKIIRLQEEPFTTPAIYSQWEVMKLAKENGAKVLLDGQGADEILCGYHYFYSYFLFELYKKGKYSKLIFEIIQISKKTKSYKFINVFIFLILPKKIREQLLRKINSCLNNEYFDTKINRNQVLEDLIEADSISTICDNHLKHKLQHLLRYEDKNSMAFSIESRTPFLDYRLVRYCIDGPSDFHIKKGYTKYSFRKSMKGIVEKDILSRTDKIGFKTMEDSWMASDKFKKFVLENLTSKSFKNRDYFDHEKVSRLLNNYVEGRKVDLKLLWRILNVELWSREFFGESKLKSN